MDVNDILKQQQTWIDNIRKVATEKNDQKEPLELPRQLKQQRIAEHKAKVDQLARRKEELVRSYDTAIAQHRTAVERLERELVREETPVRGAAAEERKPPTSVTERKAPSKKKRK